MNTPEIKATVADYTRLQDTARDMFWHIYYLRPDWQQRTFARPYGLRFVIGDPLVTVTGESRACGRGCCGTESGLWEFPTEYLTLDIYEVSTRVAAVLAELAARPPEEEDES
jgi:hypothetical protein